VVWEGVEEEGGAQWCWISFACPFLQEVITGRRRVVVEAAGSVVKVAGQEGVAWLTMAGRLC